MTTRVPIARNLKKHLFKACQRCGGDLVLDPEANFEALRGSTEYVCLQCGRSTTLRAILQAAGVLGTKQTAAPGQVA
jgi:hypothetical protein